MPFSSSCLCTWHLAVADMACAKGSDCRHPVKLVFSRCLLCRVSRAPMVHVSVFVCFLWRCASLERCFGLHLFPFDDPCGLRLCATARSVGLCLPFRQPSLIRLGLRLRLTVLWVTRLLSERRFDFDSVPICLCVCCLSFCKLSYPFLFLLVHISGLVPDSAVGDFKIMPCLWSPRGPRGKVSADLNCF